VPAAFSDRLDTIQHEKQSRLCVGLDPDPARFPSFLLGDHSMAASAMRFNAAIIEATAPFACAFKLNLAFYENFGREGARVIDETLDRLPEDVLAIADGKRADIGNSARFYAAATFKRHAFDACTISPYMGADAAESFLDYEGKAVFVLTRTTNPSADALQNLDVGTDGQTQPLYEHVARQVAAWGADAPGTAGLVAGATDPEALARLRAACPDLPFLVPGVGAQGGSAQDAVEAAGSGPMLVNSSRAILYAYDEEYSRDFADAAREAARDLRDQLWPEENRQQSERNASAQT
jgi:orotidine-5'-phosphate decarboxylase